MTEDRRHHIHDVNQAALDLPPPIEQPTSTTNPRDQPLLQAPLLTTPAQIYQLRERFPEDTLASG